MSYSKGYSMKKLSIFIIIIIIILNIFLIAIKPKMHKEFSFQVIEKIIKFNADGSQTLIQTTTERKRQ